MCSIENALLFKIKNGYLLVSYKEIICEFSFLVEENNKVKCYRKLIDSRLVEKKNLTKVSYDIEFKGNDCFVMIGPIRYKMEEESEQSEEIAMIQKNINLKKAALNVNYAKNAKMIGDTKGVENLVEEEGKNPKAYTSTLLGSYLMFKFKPCTINFISFSLWKGEGGDRSYKYNIDVRSHDEWVYLFANKPGEGLQELSFKPLNNVDAIRMTGRSNKDDYLNLLACNFSIKYNLD